MGTIEHLGHEEGLKKVKALADDKTCFFITHVDGSEIDTRPMTTVDVTEDGTFRFLCKEGSHVEQQIIGDPRAELLYGDLGGDSYLFVKGKARVFYDKPLIEKIWTPIAKAWFEDGKDDPRVRVIEVKSTDISYMDSKHGSLVSTVKIILAAITGNENSDDSRQGDINL